MRFQIQPRLALKGTRLSIVFKSITTLQTHLPALDDLNVLDVIRDELADRILKIDAYELLRHVRDYTTRHAYTGDNFEIDRGLAQCLHAVGSDKRVCLIRHASCKVFQRILDFEDGFMYRSRSAGLRTQAHRRACRSRRGALAAHTSSEILKAMNIHNNVNTARHTPDLSSGGNRRLAIEEHLSGVVHLPN